jgi:hypothetical protein
MTDGWDSERTDLGQRVLLVRGVRRPDPATPLLLFEGGAPLHR